MPTSKDGRPRGIAYVTFADHTAADAAAMRVDGSIFLGRLMHAMLAKEPAGAKVAAAAPTDPLKDLDDDTYARCALHVVVVDVAAVGCAG
jgi:RNA recognition motif-containing protein